MYKDTNYTVNTKYPKEQINEYLKNNYSINGTEFCSKELNISRGYVKNLASKLSLKLDKSTFSKLVSKQKPKQNDKYNVNPAQFYNITSPIVAYILGVLWADGYLYRNKNQQTISLSMIESDAKELLPLFEKTGKWLSYLRKRKGKLPLLTISTNNRPLVSFLYEMDYKSKSYETATKILNRIPEDLQHYWFRGLFDGDGCLYHKNRCIQLTITSSYNQNWDYLETLCKKINVIYKIKHQKIIQNNHNNAYSFIRIINRESIKSFLDYIYAGDIMGITRKFDKYKSMDFSKLTNQHR